MTGTAKRTFRDNFVAMRPKGLFGCDHPREGMFYVVPKRFDPAKPRYLYPDGKLRAIAVWQGVEAYYRDEDEIEAAYQKWRELAGVAT